MVIIALLVDLHKLLAFLYLLKIDFEVRDTGYLTMVGVTNTP